MFEKGVKMPRPASVGQFVLLIVVAGLQECPGSVDAVVSNRFVESRRDGFFRYAPVFSRSIEHMSRMMPILRRTVEISHAHMLLIWAEYHQRFGDRMRAVSAYIDILELHRCNILANLRLGEYFLEQRDYARALIFYKMAMSSGLSSEESFVTVAEMQVEIGDFAGALETVRKGAVSYPSSSVLQSMRGYQLIELGSIEEGIDSLSLAIRLDDSNVDAYINRAYGYALLRKWAEAKADLNVGLLLDPDNVYLLVDRGGVRLFSDDVAGAIQDLSTAIAKDEKRAGLIGAFWYRSQAYAVQGEIGLATKDASRAQEFPSAEKKVFRNE